jgi:cytochrome b pre-mRNA-processing protein 3
METEPALRAATARLTELFVSDMDGQLRQEGVGDLVVGKRMGKLVSALGGRIEAYRNGFAAGDALVLAQAVERNVTLVEGANPAELADAMRALAARLGATGSADLLAGRIAP